MGVRSWAAKRQGVTACLNIQGFQANGSARKEAASVLGKTCGNCAMDEHLGAKPLNPNRKSCISWVAVKELTLSYHNSDTI